MKSETKFKTHFPWWKPSYISLVCQMYASVLLLMIKCIIHCQVPVEWFCSKLQQCYGNTTDAWKTDVNLFFFTITRPEAGQMPGLNKVFKRQVWCVQVSHLHSIACSSPSFQILSVCTLIDDRKQANQGARNWTVIRIWNLKSHLSFSSFSFRFFWFLSCI